MCSNQFPNIIGLFSDKWGGDFGTDKGDVVSKVTKLKDELVEIREYGDRVLGVLDEKGAALFGHSDNNGDALVELLHMLDNEHQLSLEVLLFS